MTRKKVLQQIVWHLRFPQPKLPNGCELLACATRDADSYYIIALKARGDGSVEYVRWTMLADATCQWGHYYEDLDECIDDFVECTKYQTPSSFTTKEVYA